MYKHSGKIYRQGDILLEEISDLPNIVGHRPLCSTILAFGEVTGHAHSIVNGECATLYEDDYGNKYLKVETEAVLTHQEHGTVKISKGVYAVRNEREFDPFSEEIQRVGD